MITVQESTTKTISLKAMAVIVISNGAGTAALSFDGTTVAAAHTGTKTYGPYPNPGKFTIAATSGQVEYRVDTARNKATGVGTYASLTELAAVNAAGYTRGSVALVGPDATGQYSEWYSNGIRWRPRSGILHVKPTPASLPDTTSTETDLWSFTIPAGLIGPNDVLSCNVFWTYTNNATNKDMKLYFGGQLWSHLTTNAGAGFRGMTYLAMRNSQVSQVWASAIHGISYADGSGSSGSSLVRNVDAKQDVVIKAAAKWPSSGGGTNNITLEYIAVRLEFEA